MTKYAFIFLHSFLFCFISLDFSSTALSASVDSMCASQCAGGDAQCLINCRGSGYVSAPSASTSTESQKRVRSARVNQQPSRSSKSRTKKDNYDDIISQDPNQVTQQCQEQCGDWTKPGFEECAQKCASDLKNSASNSDGNGDSSNTTNAALSEAVNRCNVARTDATEACDQDSDTGMQGAQSALTNFAVQAGAMGMGACTKLAPLLAGANAAAVYFSQNCSSKRTACLQTCTQARTRAAEISGMNAAYLAQQQGLIDAYADECKKLDSKIAQAQQAIQNIVATAPGVSACANATNTGMASYCASNPTALGCETVATDCSNPTIAASNQICICKNNPSASGCMGAQAKAADFGNGGSADMSSLANKTKGGTVETDSSLSSLNWPGNGMTPSKDNAESVGGKKGPGANLGDGGGGGAPGEGGGKGGAAAQALQVNSGFRGGGGSGGGWGSGGGGGGNDRPYDPAHSGMNEPRGPNLRDFLPNGKADPKLGARGLAGISGPDGITGPHSDIWKKVQNQYLLQVEKSRLMP